MYERILVPLDGSDRAELALPFAEELAAKLGSEVILLCVSDSAEAEDYAKHQIYVDQITPYVRRAASKRRTDPEKPVKITPAITVGSAANEIIDYAMKKNVNLIIMATHGRSGVTHWRLGSVAEKVVRAGKSPVMLVRVPGASDV
ncbi:MAG: universal stress protein [Dehalococcoidales bacterium]|nr:universal stress protein [Dehalococcoidales bacterium]